LAGFNTAYCNLFGVGLTVWGQPAYERCAISELKFRFGWRVFCGGKLLENGSIWFPFWASKNRLCGP